MKGHELKVRRVALGLNQAQVADFLGVDRATVLRWERAEDIPRLSELAAARLVPGAEIEKYIASLKPTARRSIQRRIEQITPEKLAIAYQEAAAAVMEPAIGVSPLRDVIPIQIENDFTAPIHPGPESIREQYKNGELPEGVQGFVLDPAKPIQELHNFIASAVGEHIENSPAAKIGPEPVEHDGRIYSAGTAQPEPIHLSGPMDPEVFPEVIENVLGEVPGEFDRPLEVITNEYPVVPDEPFVAPKAKVAAGSEVEKMRKVLKTRFLSYGNRGVCEMATLSGVPNVDLEQFANGVGELTEEQYLSVLKVIIESEGV